MSALRIALGLSILTSLVGCTADAEPPGADEQAITSRDGYRPIAPSSGAVYGSVAVSGDLAFVGDNRQRIDVVDLNTVRKVGSIEGRIPNDSLTTVGTKIVACGLRDDSPLDPFGHTPPDRSYVLTFIDPATRRAEGTIELHIEGFLATNPSRGFVDLPNLSCRFDAASSKMTLTFAQRELGREVITFTLPALGARYEWRSIPGAERTAIDAGGDGTMTAAAATDDAILYTAGGWGLRRQASGARRAETLRDEGREHLVDLQLRGGHIYAVDHSGGLVIADERDGSTVERVEIPDLLHALVLTPTHVVVAGRGGLFVAKDRWAR